MTDREVLENLRDNPHVEHRMQFDFHHRQRLYSLAETMGLKITCLRTSGYDGDWMTVTLARKQ